jgi:hypothetical protein
MFTIIKIIIIIKVVEVKSLATKEEMKAFSLCIIIDNLHLLFRFFFHLPFLPHIQLFFVHASADAFAAMTLSLCDLTW